MWIDFSAHHYLETLQDLRLGFLKRPYFLKSVQMARLGDPLKIEARDSQGPILFFCSNFIFFSETLIMEISNFRR